MDRMRLHRQRQRGPEELLRRFPAYQRRIARRQAAMLAVQDDDMEIQELLGQNPVPLQEAPRQDGAPQLAPNNQNQALQIPPLGQGPEPQRGPLAIYEPVVQDGRQRVDLPLIIAPINEPPPIEAFRRVRPNLGLPIHGAPRRPQEERLRPQEPPRGVQQEAPRPPVGPQNQNQLREFLQELLGPDPNNQQVPDRNGQAFFLERIRVIVERTALRVFEEQLQRFQEHVQHRLRRPARRVQRPQRPRQRSEPPMGRPEPQQEAQWPLARGPRRPRRPQRHDPIGVPGRIRPAQEDRRD
uniref:Histone-fold n=1 Tax=Caenorhabditis tropicalis TaxID=1561998 RepID=A0A1I7UV57_9PELO